MNKVKFEVYDGEAYEAAMEMVMASPGWLEMSITDMEVWAGDEAIAEMTAYFDSEAHAVLFRLRMGV